MQQLSPGPHGGEVPYDEVVVLGMGTTGRDVTRYLMRSGRARSVTVYAGRQVPEARAARQFAMPGIRLVTGSEHIEGFYDLAVVSPGIPDRSEFFQSAVAHAREVIGEPELAWRESPERWVGITGTNGKTTTTVLTCELLRGGGLVASAVGNIGTSAISAVSGRSATDWFVAELSSFQLATAHELRPRVGVLLNVTPDHLTWHGSMEEYARAKERLFARLTADDLAVIVVGDEWCRGIADRLEARGLRVCRVWPDPVDKSAGHVACLRDGHLMVCLDGNEHLLLPAVDLGMAGHHNVLNALAAASVAIELGVSDTVVSSVLAGFASLEHRIEACGSIDGVSYVNDSKATNVDATLAALASFPQGRVVLLLGGTDKGTDLGELARRSAAACRAIICYGDAGSRIAAAVRPVAAGGPARVLEAAHLADAFVRAREMAHVGDVVLLSPACSSFDEFSGFEERGRAFKHLVSEARSAMGRGGE